ncbi:hypothetical protein DFS34DRAFT_329689 [Phlyctochytrium arcticum]|nr:hypothetical protein DFS34DRAFT_329689 [Phlyctochytrium arcticum]
MFSKLPAFLADSNKRYKEDTSRLAHWLATTSKCLGRELDIQQVAQPQAAPSKRLKGKARKAAREKEGRVRGHEAPGTGAATPRRPATKSILTVKQFKELANYIVQAGVTVPSYVLSLAERAIAVRKECSDYFRQVPGKSQSELKSDKTHWNFIEVLQNVADMLRPLCPRNVEATEPVQDAANADETVTLENKFALLDFEDLPDELAIDESSPLSSSLPAAYEIDHQEYDVEEDDSEVFFSVYCLFKDLANIRAFIQDLWKEYKAGKVDLVTASVTTNTALEMIHDLQEDFTTLHPLIEDYASARDILYLSVALRRGEHPNSTTNTSGDFNPRMVDVLEFLYIPAQSYLETLSQVIQPKTCPIYNGQYGYYDPSNASSGLTYDQRCWEDRRLLMEIMPEFVLMANMDIDFPVEDVLSAEFARFAKTKELSLALIFGTQVFLDIHHIMEKQVGRGFVELQLTGADLLKSLKARQANMSKVPSTWPKQNEKCFTQFELMVEEWILKDRLQLISTSVRETAAYRVNARHSYLLLKWHPWLSGMLQFQAYLTFQELGIVYANACGSIMYVAHLYEACKHSIVLGENKLWDDMEWVMQTHGKERMFRGRVPQTPLESLKSFCLTMGMSPAEFSSDRLRRPKKAPAFVSHPNGPIGLTESTTVSLIFRPRLCYKTGQPFTIEHVNVALQRIMSTASGGPLSKLQLQWDRRHCLTPLQLLVVLKNGLRSEKDMLRFGYLSMHTRCMNILQDLHQALDVTLTRYFGPQYLEDETQLPFVIGYLLQISTGSEAIKQKLKLKDADCSSKLMHKAGETLSPWLEKEGNFELVKMKSRK